MYTHYTATFVAYIARQVGGHILGSLGIDSASTVPHYTRYTYLVWDQAFSIKVSILCKA